MRSYILVNVHSFVDIITNSSSEIFVCDTDKSVEFIKESLADILETYNELTGYNRPFDQIFGKIQIIKPDDYELICEVASDMDYANHKHIPNTWDMQSKYCEEHGIKHYNNLNKKQIKELSGLIYDAKKKWVEDNRNSMNLVGKVLIRSEDDNSIPHPLFDLIEETFNATRLHLG